MRLSLSAAAHSCLRLRELDIPLYTHQTVKQTKGQLLIIC